MPNFLEKRLIFQGKKLDQTHQFEFSSNFEEHFIPMKDGEIINALHFKATSPTKGIIFYCHGNADNLNRWGQYSEDFLARGYDVFQYDYRGYGKSGGHPSMSIIHNDAQVLFDWMRKNIAAENISIYGRSLGTAVASQLATTRPANSLYLETPFNDLQTVIKMRYPFLLPLFTLKNNFSNESSLAVDRNFPVHIFHGTKDRIVPLKSGLLLKPMLNNSDSFTIIEGGKHKNLSSFPDFQNRLDELFGPKL